MMTNLFSVFDPSTPNFASINWLSMMILFFAWPVAFWKTNNRLAAIASSLHSYILTEFSPLVQKIKYALITVLSVFTFIMMNNIMGLMPYIFTASSHMSFALALSLPMWLAMMLYGWAWNSPNLLAHLIPTGTPMVLTPLMAIIETVSNIIRPGTLAIRLAANMIAGHLLMVLISSATPITPALALPLLIAAQTALTLLETGVAFIQAYVFSVLSSLYLAEFTS